MYQGYAAAGLQARYEVLFGGVGVAMHKDEFHTDRGTTWFLHAASIRNKVIGEARVRPRRKAGFFLFADSVGFSPVPQRNSLAYHLRP